MKKLFLLFLLIPAQALVANVNDPFENINRTFFDINEKVDNVALKPIALTYSKTPEPVKHGITNFFRNLKEIDNTLNQVLQGKPKYAINDFSRFIINSTIGIGGILDPASSMGLERHDEDFGQTLGLWGVSPGPYLMIPFLGPTTTRDLLSRPISSFLEVTFHMDDSNVRISLSALDAIETRERLLDVESLLSGDKYNFVRDSYSQSREYEIKDGLNIVDEFTDDMDDFLID
ncbi:VacJ family lipoprotein [Gammaproteobacteria bacterium]|nr:VacJ family lipoprotein [Gammaproteobacteria bacterium]MDA9842234.1 VacJ family lipoprotein [Gammaproteobacteria bacterium]MDC0409930.1 VacJ family lipoprotein [Gammaproteobacteria bacterium]|tara:strand:- start:2699 stop:3394 length:696 start_codon:yes stop_codon:yes gene_type:complete